LKVAQTLPLPHPFWHLDEIIPDPSPLVMLRGKILCSSMEYHQQQARRVCIMVQILTSLLYPLYWLSVSGRTPSPAMRQALNKNPTRSVPGLSPQTPHGVLRTHLAAISFPLAELRSTFFVGKKIISIIDAHLTDLTKYYQQQQSNSY
jgi:hypothetical protein